MPLLPRPSLETEFLNLSTVDILGWIILFLQSGGWLSFAFYGVQHPWPLPTPCQEWSPFLSCDNQKCLQTLPSVPQRVRSTMRESSCCLPALPILPSFPLPPVSLLIFCLFHLLLTCSSAPHTELCESIAVTFLRREAVSPFSLNILLSIL